MISIYKSDSKKYGKERARLWEKECMHYIGRILTGKQAHYCYNWDGLPVDETTGEYAVCECFK